MEGRSGSANYPKHVFQLLRFESQIRQAITKCFFAVNPRIVYSTRRALPSVQNDCVYAYQKSSVVYEFTCQWDSGYVGRTAKRLKVKQHVPSSSFGVDLHTNEKAAIV